MEPQQPASDDSMTTTPTPDDLALMRDLAEDRDSSPGEAAQIDQLMLARAVDQIKDVEATLDRYRKALRKIASTDAPLTQDDMRLAREALNGITTRPDCGV